MVDACAQIALGVEPVAAAIAFVDRDLFADGRRATVQHENAVGKIDGFVDVVGHEKGCLAELAAHVLEPVLHVAAGDDVERAEGLVEEQNICLAHGCAQKRCALAHAAGEGVWIGVFVAGESKDWEEGAGALGGFFFCAVDGAVETDVVEDALPGQEQIFLRHVGKMLAGAADRGAVDADGAAFRRDDAGENV